MAVRLGGLDRPQCITPASRLQTRRVDRELTCGRSPSVRQDPDRDRALRATSSTVQGLSPEVSRLSELNYEALAEQPHAPVVRADHPLTRRRRVGLEDLIKETWILPPAGNIMRDELTLLFLQKKPPLPNQIIETSSLTHDHEPAAEERHDFRSGERSSWVRIPRCAT